jgi:tetratricopeptide (TPR) repeat protein
VPLQFLAETGVIGALLGVGGFVLVLVAGIKSVRRRLPGRERLLAGGLAAAAIAYGIHCLYDWDWNIPALSLPAFLFLGILAARRVPSMAPRAISQANFTRALWLGAATVWLCTFALSAELPELAASKASAALVDGSRHSPASLRAAQADAVAATRLDPLSDAGPLAQATLALHQHDIPAASAYLRDAVARDPTDPEGWLLVVLVDGALGEKSQARLAAQRAVDLDPMGRYAQGVVARQLTSAPPTSSATRYP